MQRDGQLFTSDSVMIYIDPGQTRRNAYNFQIGASGGRTDELNLNNTEELTEWDTIWEARARVVQDGWVAEFAIPFKSLSYEAGQNTWGFDVARRIFHKNERVQWSGFNPALDFPDVSQSGNLVSTFQNYAVLTGIGVSTAVSAGNAAQTTLADYLGACMISLGEVIHLDYSAYPNVERWLGNMKSLPYWSGVHQGFLQFVAMCEGTQFEGL